MKGDRRAPREPITLIEYQPHPGVPLSEADVQALRDAAPWMAIEPDGGPGTYELTPSSYVGTIELQDQSIHIRPKLPISRLLFLLSYALDPKRWLRTSSAFSEESDLFEAIIPGFAQQVRGALAKGALRGYRTEEGALPGVRGRIRFDDQIRDRYGIAPPIEVRYDEYTEDIEPNRMIKAALHRLGRMRIRSRASRQLLRHFDSALQDVQLVEYDPRALPEIAYSRLNEHYRPALELAKLILRTTSFELQAGRLRSASFLVDMNAVFEDFVVIAIRETLGLSKGAFPQGAAGRPLFLDEGRRVRLRPDISWWDGHDCVFTGDVKYKRLRVAGYEHPDLYQLLAYTIAADLPGGLLIYAAGEAEPAIHEVVHSGKHLAVVTLDLAGDPSEVLGQIAQVARRVRRLRLEARRSTAAA